MLDLLTIKSRLITIVKIGCGSHDKLADLDISERGFKASFQALYLAILVLFIDIIYGVKFATPPYYFSEIIFNNIVASIILWFLPLGVIILALYLMQLKNKIIPFTIAYNWFHAFFSLIDLPFTLILILFPTTYDSVSILAVVVLIPLIYMLYQIYSAVFQEKFIFNFGILFFNIVLETFVISIRIIYLG